MNPAIQIDIIPSPSIETTGKLWEIVQMNSRQSVFTSWLWISAWLETDTKDNKILLIATIDQKPVGLAIWTHIERFARHQYWLHKSGDGLNDQIWIEYNDFLIQHEYGDQIREKMWQTWFMRTPRNSKYFVGASLSEAFTDPRKFARFEHLTWAAPTYLVPLQNASEASAAPDDQRLLRLMSANTRSQLKRSMQYFKTEYGELTLRFAPPAAATTLFDQAAAWHNDRWGGDGTNGFNNPAFVAFHHRLISCGASTGMADVVELLAGERTLGVFYNFIWQDKAYFYLSSLNYQDSNHARPGLVGHFLLGRHYLATGRLSYDLLGGGGYKARFSVPGAELQARVFYGAGWVNRMEAQMRTLKGFVTSLQQRLGVLRLRRLDR